MFPALENDFHSWVMEYQQIGTAITRTNIHLYALLMVKSKNYQAEQIFLSLWAGIPDL